MAALFMLHALDGPVRDAYCTARGVFAADASQADAAPDAGERSHPRPSWCSIGARAVPDTPGGGCFEQTMRPPVTSALRVVAEACEVRAAEGGSKRCSCTVCSDDRRWAFQHPPGRLWQTVKGCWSSGTHHTSEGRLATSRLLPVVCVAASSHDQLQVSQTALCQGCRARGSRHCRGLHACAALDSTRHVA